MANMSYCRFENTYSDLRDCVMALEEAESLEDMDLSSYETNSMKAMISLCREFLEQIERLEIGEE